MRWDNGEYFVSDENGYLNYKAATRLIIEVSDWGKDQQKDENTVRDSLNNSAWVFGVYKKNAAENYMIGIARIVSDKRTFGYLCDVVIEPQERSKDHGKWLMHCIAEHPDVVKVQFMILFTPDAHGLYERYGFTEFTRSDLLMIRRTEEAK
ncbi:MAG: GNAT family N-acetyltransferase [Negativicutes bacterium]|jgi:N-acetylglutamate synthase-like GNAT family acetyltransferase